MERLNPEPELWFFSGLYYFWNRKINTKQTWTF